MDEIFNFYRRPWSVQTANPRDGAHRIVDAANRWIFSIRAVNESDLALAKLIVNAVNSYAVDGDRP